LGFVLLAMVLAFGLVVAGCGPKPEPDAKWDLEQKGGVPGEGEGAAATATTKAIIVKFDKAVDSFPADVVTVSGAAEETSEPPVKGDGNNWEIPITVKEAGGEATVKIDGLDGVESGSKTVVVYKEGEVTPGNPVNPGGGGGGDTAVSIIAFAEDENPGTAKWPINEKLPFKYFIISSVGGGEAEANSNGNTPKFNGGGFGGIQPALQGADVTQEIRGTGDWLTLDHTQTEVVYFVFDLSGYDCYSDLSASGWKQFYINYGKGVLGTYQGYVVPNTVTSLTKPAGAVDYVAPSDKPKAPGYITKTLPIEIKLPE